MQTSPEAVRIRNAAHSFYPTLPLSLNQIVVKDTRLRDWQLASDGGLDVASLVKARLNEDGDIVRVRVVEGSPYLYTGTLDIRVATPADTLVWSSNTITEDALYGGGIDIYVDGNDIDVFWVDPDAVTIRTAHSADGGNTWGASSTVATVSGQGLNVLLQLCAPQADTLIFTDSTVGLDDADNPMTALYVTVKVSGTWNTPTLWDLGGQPLGVEQKVTLPNQAQHPSNLTGMVLPNGSIGISFYADSFRETFETGIWLQRVYNIDTSVTEQHLFWVKPEEIFQTIAIDDDNGATEMFCAFPHIQMVGEEYWIVALEMSQQAGHQRYNLSFFRSTDGITWSDRNYRQGAAYDVEGENEETRGAYAYNGDQPFLYTDLIFANLIVTEERTFIIGYDRSFRCPSTVLVGVENPDKELDITGITYAWDIDLPQAPSAGQGTYEIANVPKLYDGTDILTAHRGVKIYQEAGYLTEMGDEIIPVGQFHVDSITQHTELGDDTGSITALDNTMLMDRYKSPVYWEMFGPSQLTYVGFCDTTPFNTIYGSYYCSVAGNMKSGTVTSQDNFRENTAVINMTNPDGGILVTRFRCTRTWENNHVGVAFDGRDQGDSEDNKKFWVVFYNKVEGRFSLHRAEPRTNPNRVKLYRYRLIDNGLGDFSLDGSTYWLRVGVYHSRVMVWYTGNNGDDPDAVWELVLDYQAPASPATDVMPCRIGWWALLGTARTEPSGALGQLSTRGGMQSLSYNGTDPYVIAAHVQLGSAPSLLRRVNVALTQENEDSTPMPDAIISLVTGDADNPDDITDDDNIIFQCNASALLFGAHDSPRWNGANDKPNPRRTRLDAGEHVWICVTYNGTLATGQSYKWASGAIDAGNAETRKSEDGGQTWEAGGEFLGELAACIEVEYLNGLVKFSRLYFGGAEPPYTIEKLAHQIAAKSEVLDISPDDFLNQSDLTLGPDNIYWQPIAYGKIGTLVLDADVEMMGSPYTPLARIIVGSTTIDAGDGDGYVVELDSDNQKVLFYTPGNTLVMETESLCFIPEVFHVSVVNQNNFLYVYVNECLASNCPPVTSWTVATPGYVGLDSIGAVFTNVRIPDLTTVVPYWVMEGNESALSSLQKLVAKPANGAISRGRFFIRYDGSLRISSFTRQELTDTYVDTILDTNKTESQRNNLSIVRQSKNYYADRTDPVMLDTDGIIFDERDSSDALTDEDAYTSSYLEFLNSKEQQILPSFSHVAVFPAEREDRINIESPTDSTEGEANINALHFRFDTEASESMMDIQPRLVVNDA